MIATMTTHQFDRLPPKPILKAWQDWFTAHSIDYHQVPIDSVIERQVDECRVAYDAYTFPKDEDDGHIIQRCYVQLEAEPLPFPPDDIP